METSLKAVTMVAWIALMLSKLWLLSTILILENKNKSTGARSGM